MAKKFKPAKEDYERFYVEKGDPGFNPKRNKETIENTIKSHEANIRRKRKQFKETLSERSHAVASYLKSRAVQSGNPVEKYFSRRYLAYLQGKENLERIKSKLTVIHAPEK